MPEFEQLEIPIPEQPTPRPVRIRAKVTHADNHYIKMHVYLNGDMLSEGDLSIRHADVAYVVNLLDPEIIIVDRENITDTAWKQLKSYPQVELI